MVKVLTEEPDRCQITLFDVDWPEFLKRNTGLRKSPRLSFISTADSQTSSAESLAQRIILEKDKGKRAELVKEYVSLSVAEWTGISSPSETDLNMSLYSYGTDSAKALTLKMELETNLQVSFEVCWSVPSSSCNCCNKIIVRQVVDRIFQLARDPGSDASTNKISKYACQSVHFKTMLVKTCLKQPFRRD